MSDEEKLILEARKFVHQILQVTHKMENKEYKENPANVDLDKQIPLELLPDGPWKADHENHPRSEYRFKASGYRCMIRRPSHDWVWNGYITLPENHPDAKSDENTLSEATDIHGGCFTYHVGTTLGFDTQHYNDIVPGLLYVGMPVPPYSKYWRFEDVLHEIQRVAAIFKARA